jgi:outer membrane receptor protein involved in Fe transport
LFRPDLLLQPSVIDFYKIALIDINEANPVFDAELLNHGAYGQIQAQVTPELSFNLGTRYEWARQTVSPVQVFDTPTASLAGTRLERGYWLPALTATWQITPEMQRRLSGSKTIARPQFRELIFQLYFDPDNNRQFRGNPLLKDSQLYNGEARFEWYFAREQRLSLAGFYKKIRNPIETFASFSDNAVLSSFANAPRATLYGGEVETQKYLPLTGLSETGFWGSRRAVAIANYTYTRFRISVRPDDPVAVFASAATRATDLFRDGEPLTGQSDHVVNLELGLEDIDRLSQQTFLLTYASRRVTNRGAAQQPDIIEYPGLKLDFVARQGIRIGGVQLEAKLELRNLTGTKYREFQKNGDNRIFYNLYRPGRSAVFGLSASF